MAIARIHPVAFATFLTLIALAGPEARAQTGGVSVANQFSGLDLGSRAFSTNIPIDLRGVPLATGRGGDGLRNAAFLAYRERLADRAVRARILRQRRYRQGSAQRSEYQSPPGGTFNPGFTLPPTIGHFNTRFGLVTGAALQR